MSYAPLDDCFDDCPKYAECDAAEMGIIACAITYANRNLSDGRVPRSWPRRRFGKEGERLAKRMVTLCIWSVRPDEDYEIVGFLDHNLSREQVLTKRAKKSAAGTLGGLRSGETRSKRQALAEAPASPVASSKPEAPPEPNSLQLTALQPKSPLPPEGEPGVVDAPVREPGPLPRSERALWGAEWMRVYELGVVEILGRPWAFDRRQLATLEHVIETFCRDKSRIHEWIGKAALEFVKAVRDDEESLWSEYQPKGLQRWFNKDRPGYTPPARPGPGPVRATDARLEAPPMTPEETAREAEKLQAAISHLGRGGAPLVRG